MKNKYVNFISDEHLIRCIGNLHRAYLKAKMNITKQNFYSNKVDTIKLTFDSKFNGIDEESLIQAEILRQIDKSINNSIGTFHEQILGGVEGFELDDLNSFNIIAKDKTLFALFHFEEISEKIKEAIFEKLSMHANIYKYSKCYFVDFHTNNTFCEKLVISKEESTISHSRVYKISSNKFYALLTKNEEALSGLGENLSIAIDDYTNSSVEI